MGTIGNLAPAADTASSGYGGLLILGLPLLLLGWLFFTNSRRTKAMRAFSSSLAVGDKVVTSSGLFGTVRHLDDTSAWLEVSEGVTLRFDRRAVSMKQAESSAVSGVSGVADDERRTEPGQ
ncbi:MAG: preprotein translocase subunit YajC [Terracoccus sp.]